MFKHLIRASLLMLVIVLSTTVALAQVDTCSTLVQRAMTALEENCSGVDRNIACYGYDNVQATFADTVDPDFFTQPSDQADITILSTIQTAPFDEESEQWGVALMNLNAVNVEGTLPGQTVIFVMMGDAQVTNDNVDDVLATPMQAFYFTTGIGQPNCAEAPDTLVVQSPQNARVNLTINDMNVELGSTAIISSVDDGEAFEITMAHGEAVLDDNIVVPEGHWAKIPFDMENPVADGVFATDHSEEPFCRPVPDEQMAMFQTMMDNMPSSMMNYEVDTIEHDELGCHHVDGTPIEETPVEETGE